MSTVAWQRVWSVFEDVIGLPTDQQADYLRRKCADDQALRDAVEKMLEADRKASNLLDQPLVARPEPEPETEAAPTVAAPGTIASGLPAERIGPYRLIRKVGQGGMSTVFLAVRDDDTFRREVVVKLIRRGLESEAMIRRLQVERQILASLSHPHIARLYDGGATDDGLPFVVMEYVEGETIDVFCARGALSVDALIDLFLKVCDAVRYAHQNLVVHRDLKPANIMVTPDGEPKLLDFGIAKLIDPEVTSGALEPTVTWHGALTPSYASPEQIRGKRITTASDVYSLGVVLYRLLTGQLPFDFRGLSPTEIERLITQTEPTRPSVAVSDSSPEGARPAPSVNRAIRQRLSGDIDAIVLKALRSTASERYASVEQLAADLERYRDGLPVAARQGTWRYRTSKFVRRNRTPVLASALVAILLAGLGATIAWQNVQVRHERDEVRLENQKKAQVQALMLDIFEHSNPYNQQNAELTVREALDRSAPALTAGLENQPDLRAELLHSTGAIRTVLGDEEQAAVELTEAHALRRHLHGRDHRDTVATASALAVVRARLGELDQAEALARESVASARVVARTSGDDSVLIQPLTNLVTVFCLQSAFDAALAPALEAYALIAQAPDAHPYDIAINELLGSIHTTLGDYTSSATRYREAVALRRARHGEHNPLQAPALNNLGLALRRADQFDEAEAVFRQVLQMEERSFGVGPHPDTTITKINLAGVFAGRGDFARAEAQYRKALKESEVSEDSVLACVMRMGIAQSLMGQGRAAEAETDLRAVVRDLSATLGSDHWRVAQANSLLGASISVQGRFDEAQPLVVESYQHLVDRSAKARHIDDAFEHLRQHFERAGRENQIATHAAYRDTE